MTNSDQERASKLLAIGTAIIAGSVGGRIVLALASELFFQTEPIGLLAAILASGTGIVLGLALWFFLIQQFRRSANHD